MHEPSPLERASWVAGIVAAAIALLALLQNIPDERAGPRSAVASSGSTPEPSQVTSSITSAPTQTPREVTKYLVDEDYVAGQAYWDDNRVVEMGGRTFAHSIIFPIQDTPTWLEYNLQGRCTTFDVTLTMSDRTSDISNTALAEIWVDGVLRKSVNVSFGSLEDVSISVVGTSRIRLASVRNKDLTGRYALAFADARVSCPA